MRNRHWILTIFDYEPEDFLVAAKAAKASSACCQREKCPDTGRLHVQAYIGFPDAKTFVKMQKLFKGAHIEPAKSPLDAWAYCTKEETRVDGPYLHGDPPRPKQDRAGDRAKHNALLLDIGAVEAYKRGLVRAEDYCRVSRALDEIRAKDTCRPVVSRSDLDNHWLYGATGTGKSKYARETWPNHYLKDITKWWDHYDGQPAILVDDLDPEHKFLAKQLKNWSDHYPFTPEVKGGRLPPIRPATIIVTSQYHPTDIFTPEDARAILRRFKLMHFVGDLQGP